MMDAVKHLQHLERRRDWCVLMIWSPGLWLVAPLPLALQASGWSVPPGVADVLLSVWMVGLALLLAASIVGAFGMAILSKRIEEGARQAADIPTGPSLRTGPFRGVVAGETLVLVRRLAPLPVRWVVNALASAVCMTVIVEAIVSGPVSARQFTDLLTTLAIVAVFFGPAWLFATWMWVVRVRTVGDGVRVATSAGPWMFGPIRGRSRVVMVPWSAVLRSGYLVLTDGKAEARLAKVAGGSYGRRQAACIVEWVHGQSSGIAGP